MSDGTQIAKAYVQILPSAKGIKNTLKNEMGGAADEAGAAAGSKIIGLIK